MSILTGISNKLFGSKQSRDVKNYQPYVEQINALEPDISKLTDYELSSKTVWFKERLDQGARLNDILVEAFAVVREVGKRQLNMRHFDVQLIGGIVLHEGKIAEMATGEGKTLVATLPLYLNGLTGKGAHLVTVNDYLARRDAEWMGPIYKFLGQSVGLIPNDMAPADRRKSYACDIVYGTNNEFGFDYLRDNMASNPEDMVQCNYNFAIVDEVDSILIDEARTPLIISGMVDRTNTHYQDLKNPVARLINQQNQLASRLVREGEDALKEGDEYEAWIKLCIAQKGAPKHKRLLQLMQEKEILQGVYRVQADFKNSQRLHELEDPLFYLIDEKQHSVELTERGAGVLSPIKKDLHLLTTKAVDDIAEMGQLTDEDIHEMEEKQEINHTIGQLIRAYSLYEKDVEYIVKDGEVMIVDEFTGRLMSGRRFSDGLHEALEAKENVTIKPESKTLATITIQNYFRMYEKLAGMTGTAATEADEFYKIYGMQVVQVPTNKPLARLNYEDVIYRTEKEKYNSIAEEIKEVNAEARPILVGTTSVDNSENLSKMLRKMRIKHNVLNAKQHEREAEIVADAGQPGAVTIATNMAGRGTDIVLGEGVKEKGGLHIIGTERHDARRIDNQLKGRAGRQGDPGSAIFFLSLEDELMRLFGSDRIATIMAKIGVPENEPITHKLVTSAIEKAQKRVEAENFSVRKHLLEYDDVLNKQRAAIYEFRQGILKNDDNRELIMDMLDDLIEDMIDRYCPEDSPKEDWDLKALQHDLERLIVIPLPRDSFADYERWNRDNLMEFLSEKAKQVYQARESRIEPEQMRYLEKMVSLHMIGATWQEHLIAMEDLKKDVRLRAYAQKEPLTEYKKDGYAMFENIRTQIKTEILRTLFRIDLQQNESGPRGKIQGSRQGRRISPSASGKGPVRKPAPIGASKPSQAVESSEISQGLKKVGRNDPCPCGSGKKYKKCCGS